MCDHVYAAIHTRYTAFMPCAFYVLLSHFCPCLSHLRTPTPAGQKVAEFFEDVRQTVQVGWVEEACVVCRACMNRTLTLQTCALPATAWQSHFLFLCLSVSLLQYLCTTPSQAPVQTFTGNVSSGLKGGLFQAKALLNKAAGAVSDAAAATATSVSAAATKTRTGGGAGGVGSSSAAAGSTGGSKKDELL